MAMAGILCFQSLRNGLLLKARQRSAGYIEANPVFATVMDVSAERMRVYLDHAATTPMRPEAITAVMEGMARWANPSSPHAEGRAAKQALEDARTRIKKALGWRGELIFTSGASEALAIGLGRADVERRLISAVEHDAVFRAAPDATVLPVKEGEVDRDVLQQHLRDGGRSIVAIQQLNSETGSLVLMPYVNDPVIELVHAAGGLLLSDCSQSAGKRPLPDADMIVLSAHKLGGPPGIGALLVRDFAMLQPQGGQEQGYRSGTENLPGVIGFAAAVEVATDRQDATGGFEVLEAMGRLKDAVWSAGGMPIDGGGGNCIHIKALAAPSKSAAAQLIGFDAAGFAVSAGSACSSGSLKPSRVLKAFGVPDDVAARTMRVSTGWSTTVAEVEAFQEAWLRIAV
jgi:cysteine desulfurase